MLEALHPEGSRRFLRLLNTEQSAQVEEGWRRNRERVDLAASNAEMSAAPPVPDVAQVGIARGITPDPAGSSPGWPVDLFEAIWQESPAELAAMSPRGVF